MSKLWLKDAAFLRITTSSANTEYSDSYLFILKAAFARQGSFCKARQGRIRLLIL
jgi:hypothetical protein